MAALMPLGHAQEELERVVMDFRNEMLHRGIKELPPREWVEEFRSWLDAADFEREYEENQKWLADLDARDKAAGCGGGSSRYQLDDARRTERSDPASLQRVHRPNS